MPPFTQFSSRIAPLLVSNIDTDQIIPARFLKAIDKAGMGSNLFADWRYLPDGTPNPNFVLNKPEYQGCQILLAGDNFGCGSSREHAPWALSGFGFRTVISTSFADIFRNNSLKNGLLPVIVSPEDYSLLVDLVEEAPQAEITVDLVNQQLLLPGGHTVPFPLDSFSKTCLVQGIDELGYLLNFSDQISHYEKVNGK